MTSEATSPSLPNPSKLPAHCSKTAEPPALVERLDPHLLSLLAQLFPEPALHGIEFLAHLCRQATEKQYALFPGQQETAVAVITCQGVPDFIAQPGWKWNRETTLIMLQALETLTILVRRRRTRRTEIHIPLGKCHLDPSVLLKRLMCTKYKNKKTRRFMACTASRLRQLFPSLAEPTPENGQLEEAATPPSSFPAHWTDRLLTILEEEGVPRSCRQRIAFRLALAEPASRSTPPTPHQHVTCTSQLTTEPAPTPPTDDFVEGSARTYQLGLDGATRQALSVAQQTANRCTAAGQTSRETIGFPVEGMDSIAPNLMETDNAAGADLSPQSEAHDENTTLEPVYTDPETEARAIWKLLTTPAQRRLPGTARQLQQIRERLHEQPVLVRVAMINTLMQRVFPDRHGQPGMGWFLNTYRLYVEERLPITPEIASWVLAPLTYEQVEAALYAERERQERYLLVPSRPDASCLQDNQWPDDQTSPTSVPQWEDRWPANSHKEHYPFREQGEYVPPYLEAETADQEMTWPAADEGAGYEVIAVDGPEVGWDHWFRVKGWYQKLTVSPLAEHCAIEVRPTQYGHFVLLIIPHDDPEAAWIWTTGREVRDYLAEVRAGGTQLHY